MNTSEIRESIKSNAAHFRLTEPRIARRQAKNLIRAKAWLSSNELCAVAIGSKFNYQPATGAVLRAQ